MKWVCPLLFVLGDGLLYSPRGFFSLPPHLSLSPLILIIKVHLGVVMDCKDFISPTWPLLILPYSVLIQLWILIGE
jgi:hypothetical protein